MSTSVSDNRFRKRWIYLFAVFFLIGFAQTPWCLGVIGHLALRSSDINLTFDSISGFWMNSLEFRGIEGSMGGHMIHVDTAQVSLSVGQTLSGRLHVSHVLLINPRVHIRNTSSEMPDRIDGKEDSESGPIDFLWVDSVDIHRGSLHLEELNLHASGLQIQGSVSPTVMRIDALVGDVVWDQETFLISSNARVQLDQEMLYVEELSLRGPESVIHVRGYAGEQTDLDIQADPLSADVLRKLIPQADEDLMLAIGIQGVEDSLQVVLDFESSNGSTLKLRGNTLVGKPSISLDTLEFKNFDLAYVLPHIQGGLTGMIHGQLYGASWDSLDGRVEANLQAGTLANFPYESIRFTSEMQKGIVQLSVQSDLALGTLNLVGSMEPLQEMGKLTGEFRNLNTGVLSPLYQSNLSGNLSLDWGEIFLGNVEFLPGRLGGVDITGGGLRMYSGDEAFEFLSVIHLDSAQIMLEIDRRESGLSGQLDIHALNVGDLMDWENRDSQVNLTARTMMNWPPDTIVVEVDLKPLFWEHISIKNGHIVLSLDGFDLNAQGRIGFPSGDATIDGRVNFSSAAPRWTLNHAQITGLDLKDLGVDISTDLNAQLNLFGSGLKNASGELILQPSSVNQELITQGRFSLNMNDGEAMMESHLMFESGYFQASARVDPFATQPMIGPARGIFERVNLGALAGIDSFVTDLSGRIDSLTWNGAGAATLSLDAGSVNAMKMSGAQFEFKADHELVIVKGGIELGQGDFFMDHLQIGPDQTLLARGSLRNLFLDDLGVGDIELSGSFDMNLERGSPQTMTIHHAHFNSDHMRLGNVQFDRIRIEGTMEEGNVRLDQFDLSSDAGYLKAEGGVSLFEDSPDSLRFHGAITNASLLQDWTGNAPLIGTVTDTLWGDLIHQSDSLRWRVGVTTGPLVWNHIRLFQGTGYAEGSIDEFEPRVDRADITLERLSIPTLSARHMWLNAVNKRDTMQYGALLEVDDHRSLYLEAETDLATRRGLLRRLDMYLGQDEWNLGSPAEILTDEGIQIRYFVLESQAQEIAIDGILNPDGEQRLGLNLHNVQLSHFSDILGLPGLGGIANADLFFHGPATAPELNGSVNLIVDSESNQVGSLSARIGYKDYGLDMEADFLHVDGSTLSVSGLLPLDLRLKKQHEISYPDASVTLKSDQFNLAWISPFLRQDEVRDVEGKLSADLQLSGSLINPNLSGNLNLFDGRALFPEINIIPSDLELDVVMRRDTIYVQRMVTSSGRGGAESKGYLTISDQIGVDLAVNLNNFRVVNTAPYSVDINGSVVVGGTVLSPDLTGQVEVTNAVIRPQDVPVNLADGTIQFTEIDLQMLERNFNIRPGIRDIQTYSLIDASTLDLSIGIPGTARILGYQNPEMTILLTGSVVFTKAPHAEQEIVGTVSIVPEISYLRQFGRRFDIRRGRVTFDGSIIDPYFDLQAALDIPNRSEQGAPVTILLDASGRVLDSESLSFELRSEPIQLDRADLISYMATGRPAADAFQLSEGGALQSGSDLALQQLSNLVAGAAGAGLGLDVVQINPEPGGVVWLTAGKYVSRNLFASVKWPITAETSTQNTLAEHNSELVIEYGLFPWLLARMRGETGAAGLTLLYQYTW